MDLKSKLTKVFNKQFKLNTEVEHVSYVGGGSINSTHKVKYNGQNYFVKTNSASRFPGMFEKEAKGLELLGNAQCINVPEVIFFTEDGDDSFLVLKFIKSGSVNAEFWDTFASQLACLHKNTSVKFGLDHDNFIGSLNQYNNFKNSWSEFFTTQRLEIQLKMAIDSNSIDRSVIKNFNNFYNRIDEIFPNEKPSLIHGDLWGGNFMATENSIPYIIDPAVYYGHREMDIAMSQLFGGFSYEFYNKYNQYYPLEPGWQKRVDFCNLYPLLVHVNLFGGSYANSVKRIIEEF